MNYESALKSFLNYQAGKINNYDRELFKFCGKLGFDLGTILAIYFAHNRKDIQQILENEIKYDYFSSLTRILVLKKLSAEQKFRDAYGINNDNDIKMIQEKSHIWI